MLSLRLPPLPLCRATEVRGFRLGFCCGLRRGTKTSRAALLTASITAFLGSMDDVVRVVLLRLDRRRFRHASHRRLRGGRSRSCVRPNVRPQNPRLYCHPPDESEVASLLPRQDVDLLVLRVSVHYDQQRRVVPRHPLEGVAVLAEIQREPGTIVVVIVGEAPRPPNWSTGSPTRSCRHSSSDDPASARHP